MKKAGITDSSQVTMIGDAASDVLAGYLAGTQVILVGVGKLHRRSQWDLTAAGLRVAVEKVGLTEYLPNARHLPIYVAGLEEVAAELSPSGDMVLASGIQPATTEQMHEANLGRGL